MLSLTEITGLNFGATQKNAENVSEKELSKIICSKDNKKDMETF